MDGHIACSILTDFPRPRLLGDEDCEKLVLPVMSALTFQLHGVAESLQVPISTIFASAYILMLSAYSCQEDILCGFAAVTQEPDQSPNGEESSNHAAIDLSALRARFSPDHRLLAKGLPEHQGHTLPKGCTR